MAKNRIKQVSISKENQNELSKIKAENNKTEKSNETEEQLKKKVESLVGIIEELSSNVDKQGLPEIENIIEAKLKDLNEKFEFKFQDLKNSLDALEKKSNKGRSKEEISALIEEFKKTIEPRFTTIEEKLGMLDKLENTTQQVSSEVSKKTNTSQPVALQLSTPSQDFEQMKKYITGIDQTLSSVKEQIDLIKDSVRAQGLLDSQDIQKLERILLSIEEMIPQKNVIENFKSMFREINDLKKRFDDFNSEIEKLRQIQDSQFNSLSSRLETLVKYLNSTIQEREESYAELQDHLSDIDTMVNDLNKSQEYILNEIRSVKDINNIVVNKMKIIDDMQKDIKNSFSKEDFRRFNSQLNTLDKDYQYIFDEIKKQKDIINEILDELRILSDLKKLASKDDLIRVEESLKKNINLLQTKTQEIQNNLNKIENNISNKIWVKDILEKEKQDLISFVNDKINKLQKNFEENTKKNNEIIKKIVSEKKEIENKLITRREKISSILKELRS